MPAPGNAQELGVLPLGMQSVCGNHAPGQVQRPEERGEPGDLIGRARDARLGQHCPGPLVDGLQARERVEADTQRAQYPRRRRRPIPPSR